MSAIDVFSELKSKNERLLDKMVTNHDLCSTVMGLLGRIIYSAQVEQNRPVNGIAIGDLIVRGTRSRPGSRSTTSPSSGRPSGTPSGTSRSTPG